MTSFLLRIRTSEYVNRSIRKSYIYAIAIVQKTCHMYSGFMHKKMMDFFSPNTIASLLSWRCGRVQGMSNVDRVNKTTCTPNAGADLFITIHVQRIVHSEILSEIKSRSQRRSSTPMPKTAATIRQSIRSSSPHEKVTELKYFFGM